MTNQKHLDHGYAWVIVAAGFGIQFLIASTFIGFSLLLIDLTQVFNTSKATAGWAGSLASGIMCLSGKFIVCMCSLRRNWLID